jgi:phosphoribosylamine--glycine ligase
MKILVVGSGGREHALAWKFKQSSKVSRLFCAPGNPGIEQLAELVPVKATDLFALADFAETEHIDLTVVGPEQPLAAGIVDLFEERGLRIFGPTKRAAELEWSKAFAKEFMRRYSIPTASYKTFNLRQIEEANSYVDGCSLPLVLKADGLAAGKGVVVCETREEAVANLTRMMRAKLFGSAGDTVLVEEFMDGEEASVFAVCDGKNFITLAPAQDHKRVLDGDLGKNTGGMGAYSPAPLISEEMLITILETIITPTLRGMAQDGRPYKGCLYVGLMVTDSGPKVLEFNSRLGDPEAQVVLPLFEGDIVDVFVAACDGELEAYRAQVNSYSPSGAAVCVVVASGGYPDDYSTGDEIHGLNDLDVLPNVVVFHAGTKRDNGRLVTAGGRVLGVTASVRNGSVPEAIELAYKAVSKVSFAGMHFRSDIGNRALTKVQLG